MAVVKDVVSMIEKAEANTDSKPNKEFSIKTINAVQQSVVQLRIFILRECCLSIWMGWNE